MNTIKRAGGSGKSFYAALALSVAMVGAACWYAYTSTGRKNAPETAETESSISTSLTAQTTTTAFPLQTTDTAARTTRTTAVPAEEAAAILRRTTTAAETTAVAAETTARAELPAAPVSGAVIEPFSCGELVKSKTTGIWQTHNGTDYAAAIGSEVAAALDGTVTAIERDALWGVCVTLLHSDGTVTRYCGLNEGLNVQSGQILERGTVLGAIGDTNEAEGAAEAHLHFEVLQNGQYVDPELFLQQTQ